MAQDAVIVRFAGDPRDLAPKYAAGLRRFSAEHPEIKPVCAFLGTPEGAQPTDELLVVLLWPTGVSHGVLGRFFLLLLPELGLPVPRVEHVRVAASSFEAAMRDDAIA